MIFPIFQLALSPNFSRISQSIRKSRLFGKKTTLSRWGKNLRIFLSIPAFFKNSRESLPRRNFFTHLQFSVNCLFHLNPVPLCLEKTQEKQSASAFWKNLDCGEIDEEKLQDAKRAARSFLPIIILSMES